MYADKNGVMSQDRQRKMFILADMIVAGEGEGPLCPQPKFMGILAGGWEQIAVDTVIAALMGFSAERIPAIANAGFGTKYSLSNDVITITSNALAYRDKTIREIRQEAVPFIPTSGWKQWLLEETV